MRREGAVLGRSAGLHVPAAEFGSQNPFFPARQFPTVSTVKTGQFSLLHHCFEIAVIATAQDFGEIAARPILGPGVVHALEVLKGRKMTSGGCLDLARDGFKYNHQCRFCSMRRGRGSEWQPTRNGNTKKSLRPERQWRRTGVGRVCVRKLNRRLTGWETNR